MVKAGKTCAISALILLFVAIGFNEACSVFCPNDEKVCICSNGIPPPTPDPSGLIIQDSWEGKIHYCSEGGVCKPDNNGCAPGKFKPGP